MFWSQVGSLEQSSFTNCIEFHKEKVRKHWAIVISEMSLFSVLSKLLRIATIGVVKYELTKTVQKCVSLIITSVTNTDMVIHAVER